MTTENHSVSTRNGCLPPVGERVNSVHNQYDTVLVATGSSDLT